MVSVKERYNLPAAVAFCRSCTVSNQRPRISFDRTGQCSACLFQIAKKELVDWEKRERELRTLLDGHRRGDGAFDCIVPCSGGKDGSFVAHQLKEEYGMNPLCVTWSPLVPTDHGSQNLRRFIEAGFSHNLFTPDPELSGRLSWWSLKELGDPFQPFIYGQTNYPLKVSVENRIPLIFYGENGEVEYGGDGKNADSATREITDHDKHYFSGVGPDYWGDRGFSETDLAPYKAPDAQKIRAVGTEIHFFGYYKEWNPQENFYYAAKHTGFLPNPERSEGTYSKYASLDDKVDGFHYYLAYLKFGLGRATSDSAHEIRDGIISRDEGVALVKKYDAEFPNRFKQECLDFWGASEQELHKWLKFWTNDNLFEVGSLRAELRNPIWQQSDRTGPTSP